jgi:hypothetical protein
VATIADILVFRPVVILGVSLYEFLEVRATGWMNQRRVGKVEDNKEQKDVKI